MLLLNSTLKLILFNFCRDQLLCWTVHKKAAIKIKCCKLVQSAGLPVGLPLQLIHVKRPTLQSQWLLHSTLRQ